MGLCWTSSFCHQNFGEEKNDESGFSIAKGEGEEEQPPSPDLHSRRKKRKLALLESSSQNSSFVLIFENL
ncbi:hypothetical protein D8674_023867 [Pyrus ussuriensis x Pyrus communis]|uniref:Uncharacterized protein n=1 Tax=Pyrus ussuriensis x Pyrus communis TaxID=2448454 RepID=A0A5N5H1D6_9ROSA|nr:hypothetical protein D8674_023867 [Pyrus ussuriensis x Pyrus communis]